MKYISPLLFPIASLLIAHSWGLEWGIAYVALGVAIVAIGVNMSDEEIKEIKWQKTSR